MLIGISLNGKYKILSLPEKLKWLGTAFKVLVVCWLASFVIVVGILALYPKSEETSEADYLMILGGGLRGGEITQTLKQRLDRGLLYLNRHKDIPVIVSGGRGTGEYISEGEAMERYLIANGIKKERIIKEERSTSTMENFKYVKAMLPGKDNQQIKLMIVTNDFHMFRSKLLAKRNGFIAYGIPSGTPPSVVMNCYIREYFALIKSLLFDR